MHPNEEFGVTLHAIELLTWRFLSPKVMVHASFAPLGQTPQPRAC